MAHRAIYDKDVPTQVPPKCEMEWMQAHPGQTWVGRLCQEVYNHHRDDWRAEMEDKFDAEGRLDYAGSGCAKKELPVEM